MDIFGGGIVVFLIEFIVLGLFLGFGICFMNLVIDVREDKKWDREIRMESAQNSSEKEM